MKKLIILFIAFSAYNLQASSFKTSGYGFYTMSSCDSKIRDEFGKYCVTVISNITEFHECNPVYSGGCRSWDFSNFVNIEISPLLSRIGGSAVYPSKRRRDAEDERYDKIRSARNQGHKVLRVNWRRSIYGD